MSQNIVNDLNVARVRELQYERMEIDPSEVLEGEPVWEIAKVWSNHDGRIVAASFKSTPGKFRMASQIDEIVTLLEGHITVTAPDGTAIECRAGDFIQLKRGETYTWDVHENMTDYVVMIGDEPLPF